MWNWYIFFVRSGKENIVCKHLNTEFGSEESVSFFPKIELVYKNSKQVRKELKPMFPGYVFVETKRDGRSFITFVERITKKSKYIIKLLGKGNPDYMAVNEKEKAFLLGFLDGRYIVGESIGFIEGDRVFMTSGPLLGKESTIKRIDRHKRCAEIELEFMGDVRRVSVSVEIVEKLPER